MRVEKTHPNAPSSKKLVEQTNIRLPSLPPHAPELNPVEHLWDKLRKSVSTTRSLPALMPWRRFGNGLVGNGKYTKASQVHNKLSLDYWCLIEMEIELKILDPKWYVHRRRYGTGRDQMMGLIVKENVRSQHWENFGFVDATQKERIVDHDFPTL